MKYNITTEQKNYFSSVLLLNSMINDGKIFNVLLQDDDELLEPIFIHMTSKGWLNITNDEYTPTKLGRDLLINFMSKLTEFRALYKVFSAVDLGEGTFGYSKYFDFQTDEEFEKYLLEPQFEDLRVAVCEMKGINPLEIIFMELLNEGRFDTNKIGYQEDLTMNLIWDEMLDIANTNLKVDDLTEYDENNNVTATGKEVMEIILNQGVELCQFLLKEQKKIDEENSVVYEEVVEEEYITEPVYEYSYYDVYYEDPYYVSPIWLLMWY